MLLALIRNIMIKDNTGKDQTGGLLATIQRANIEVERDLTNKQKTITAVTAAKLEEALKSVDVARETVASDTNVKVANIAAEGTKKAAEIPRSESSTWRRSTSRSASSMRSARRSSARPRRTSRG